MWMVCQGRMMDSSGACSRTAICCCCHHERNKNVQLTHQDFLSEQFLSPETLGKRQELKMPEQKIEQHITHPSIGCLDLQGWCPSPLRTIAGHQKPTNHANLGHSFTTIDKQHTSAFESLSPVPTGKQNLVGGKQNLVPFDNPCSHLPKRWCSSATKR